MSKGVVSQNDLRPFFATKKNALYRDLLLLYSLLPSSSCDQPKTHRKFIASTTSVYLCDFKPTARDSLEF